MFERVLKKILNSFFTKNFSKTLFSLKSFFYSKKKQIIFLIALALFVVFFDLVSAILVLKIFSMKNQNLHVIQKKQINFNSWSRLIFLFVLDFYLMRTHLLVLMIWMIKKICLKIFVFSRKFFEELFENFSFASFVQFFLEIDCVAAICLVRKLSKSEPSSQLFGSLRFFVVRTKKMEVQQIVLGVQKLKRYRCMRGPVVGATVRDYSDALRLSRVQE